MNWDASIAHSWEPLSAESVQQLFPRLQVLGLSAVGGFSAVYRVKQDLLDRELALKLLRTGDAADAEQWAERFRKEALLLSRLHHKCIPAIYDYGHTPEGYWYCLMEFVPGRTLHEGHYTMGWNLGHVAEYLAKAAEGLNALHEAGVVHGDIKPDNIMVDALGNVKIIDFGTSSTPGEYKLVGDLDAPRQVTAGFAAPEAADKNVPYHRSVDIYGLGATFLQFVLGEPPPVDFGELSARVKKLPRPLRRFFWRSLNVDPNQRFWRAFDLADALRSLPNNIKGLRAEPVAQEAGTPPANNPVLLPPRLGLLGFLRQTWTALLGR
jgi:serine/threonine-protein kinase